MSDIHDVDRISRVAAKPGDVIVLQAKGPISSDVAARLTAYAQRVWPSNVVIVLGDDIAIKILEGGNDYYGVVGPHGLPVIYGTRQQAEEDCDADERVALYRVIELPLPTQEEAYDAGYGPIAERPCPFCIARKVLCRHNP